MKSISQKNDLLQSCLPVRLENLRMEQRNEYPKHKERTYQLSEGKL
jgi:hypothetical protein